MGKEDVAVTTIIGKGATFDGLLEVSGGLRVDGTVKGKIVSADIVLVGPSGTVDADIDAKETIVGGIVRGNVKSPDKVELQTKSQMEGDVVTYSLVVEQGAIFHGNCQMKKDKGVPAQATPASAKDTGSLIGARKPDQAATFQKAKA